MTRREFLTETMKHTKENISKFDSENYQLCLSLINAIISQKSCESYTKKIKEDYSSNYGNVLKFIGEHADKKD